MQRRLDVRLRGRCPCARVWLAAVCTCVCVCVCVSVCDVTVIVKNAASWSLFLFVHTGLTLETDIRFEPRQPLFTIHIYVHDVHVHVLVEDLQTAVLLQL